MITGKSIHTIKIGDAERAEPGEMEIALQFPDKLSQRVSIGSPGDHKMVMNQVDVAVVTKTKDGVGAGEGRGTGVGSEPGTHKIVIKKDDGTVQEVNADVVIERSSGGTGESTFTTKDGKGRSPSRKCRRG